jgi:hypothetical protein
MHLGKMRTRKRRLGAAFFVAHRGKIRSVKSRLGAAFSLRIVARCDKR